MTQRPQALPDEEQRRRRDYFREHFQRGVAFNRLCGVAIVRFDADGVEYHLPYAEQLSGQDGIFHGGVVASLIDTTGTGAVLAGHDFAKGSRISTISMSVSYLAPASGGVLVARGRCTQRGGRVHFADVTVATGADGPLMATGQVIVNISGEKAGAPWVSPPVD